MDDSYIYVIVALLPVSAFMLTVQVNPYHALVIRGILGGVAALVYAVLGAADVALTEALVGTMLAITLYAVAVRSSLVLRLGVLKDEFLETDSAIAGEVTGEVTNVIIGEATGKPETHPALAPLIADLRTLAKKYHLRLELVPYPDPETLNQSLLEKEVHVTCLKRSPQAEQEFISVGEDSQPYQTTTRIRRLYEIFQTERLSSKTHLDYVIPSDCAVFHVPTAFNNQDNQEKPFAGRSL